MNILMETTASTPDFPSFRVLGVRVHCVQIPDVIERIGHWIAAARRGCYISVTGMHGVMEARRDTSMREVLNSADLVVPDGMSLVWVGRHLGFQLPRRVYGPELMETFFRATRNQYRHFFFGAAPGIAERLAQKYRRQFDAQVVGTYSPPFRPLTETEHRELFAAIERSSADIVWVGLSTPKQEKWMHANRHDVPAAVMVGVGAAFDFNCGNVRQAPRWMREHGLEWFFRLITEPRRLWHRYLVLGSRFVWNVSLELSGLRK